MLSEPKTKLSVEDAEKIIMLMLGDYAKYAILRESYRPSTKEELAEYFGEAYHQQTITVVCIEK